MIGRSMYFTNIIESLNNLILSNKMESTKPVVKEEILIADVVEGDDIVTAFTIAATSDKGIDYAKLTERFGCFDMTEDLKAKMAELTDKPLHRLIRRGVFFCHRDLDLCLESYAKGQPFYLYTGRGPSAEALHLGHAIPFIMT